MCLVVFAMWDALLLWLAWWSCDRFGTGAVQQYKVRRRGIAIFGMGSWLCLAALRAVVARLPLPRSSSADSCGVRLPTAGVDRGGLRRAHRCRRADLGCDAVAQGVKVSTGAAGCGRRRGPAGGTAERQQRRGAPAPGALENVSLAVLHFSLQRMPGSACACCRTRPAIRHLFSLSACPPPTSLLCPSATSPNTSVPPTYFICMLHLVRLSPLVPPHSASLHG